MRRTAILSAVAFGLLLPASASAIQITKTITDHRRVVLPTQGTIRVPIERQITYDVAPPDSDDDGCADSADGYDGPGCEAPAPAPAYSSPGVVAEPTPAPASSVPMSSVGLSAPVDPSCESGGDPTTNTGNGYFGAYQFDSSTWDAYGDSAYAEASDAPMSVQTAAANAVPYDAWPNC